MRLRHIEGLMAEFTITGKSPLTPLRQRGVLLLPLKKGGQEGFYNQCRNYSETAFRKHKITSLVVSALILFLVACAPLIGPYSPTAYKNATSLKADALALMDKATKPYSEYEQKVASLMVEIDEAYEYVHGIPSDNLSARQWEILRDPDGSLLGMFFYRWKAKGTLSRAYIHEFKGIISDAFDEIICLEANKKSAKLCLK